MRLVNRGSIRSGYYADLAVFDLGKLDHPLERDSRQPPKGVKYVIVNGKIVVENGKLTGVRAGKVLLRSSHTK